MGSVWRGAASGSSGCARGRCRPTRSPAPCLTAAAPAKGDRTRTGRGYACWGWIGWADLHFLTNRRPKGYARAEELLRRGYSSPGVRDREDIADRLAALCRETGRDQEANALAAEAKRLSRFGSGVSVRRAIKSSDAGDRTVVSDPATASFAGDRFPL
jgi:hypothetical protein